MRVMGSSSPHWPLQEPFTLLVSPPVKGLILAQSCPPVTLGAVREQLGELVRGVGGRGIARYSARLLGE